MAKMTAWTAKRRRPVPGARAFLPVQRLLVFSLVATLALAATAQTTTIHVAPTGNDAAAATADSPFATIAAALAKARELRRADQSNIEIVLADGYYLLQKPLSLDRADSGTPNAPLRIRAATGATPILSGGNRDLTFQPLTTDTPARLPKAARPHVRIADLHAAGVTDFGKWSIRGFGIAPVPTIELFVNDQRLPVATYPNSGWLRIDNLPDGPSGKALTVQTDHPHQWHNEPNLWLYGYWKHDWADHLLPVAGVKDNRIDLAKTHSYGLKKGARFRVVNALSELDSPGEWYCDHATGTLYLWPPADGIKSHLVTRLTQPLLTIRDAAHVELHGITFEGGRHDLVTVRNSTAVVIANCTARFGGRSGFVISGGKNCEVRNSHVHNLGGTGIVLSGGDRKSLTPANHRATDNHVHHFGETLRTYQPGIRLAGVGNHAFHNHLHHAPHMAIGYGGNDHRIAFNNVHHVLLDTDDAGAFYIGRDWTARGHVIEWNYLHHSGPKYAPDAGSTHKHGTNLIYHDDCASGITTRHNILHDSYRAFLVGGGRDNLVEDNLIIGGNIGVWVDARGLGWAKDHVKRDGHWGIYKRLEAMKFDQPPYRTRYPKLATMLHNNPHAPIGTTVRRNISLNVPTPLKLQTATPEMLTIEENQSLTRDLPEAWLADPNLLLEKLGRPLPPAPIGPR